MQLADRWYLRRANEWREILDALDLVSRRFLELLAQEAHWCFETKSLMYSEGVDAVTLYNRLKVSMDECRK